MLHVSVAQRSYRPPKEDETVFREEFPHVASLCNAARDGKVEFFTSFELHMEATRQKGSPQGYLGINLLQGIPMMWVPCPVQRSIVFGGTASVGITEGEQMEFFRSLRNPRFLEIMDKRFRNVVHYQRNNVKSVVLVMTPKELSGRLGPQPVDIKRLAAEINPFS